MVVSFYVPCRFVPRRAIFLSVSPCKSSIRAVSSAVERFVYTEDVGGSIPSPPTIFSRT
jgi:hypothetical protein